MPKGRKVCKGGVCRIVFGRVKGTKPKRRRVKKLVAPKGKIRTVHHQGVKTGTVKCDNRTIRNAINKASGAYGARACAKAAQGVAVLKKCDLARGVGRRGGVSTGNFIGAMELMKEYTRECGRRRK